MQNTSLKEAPPYIPHRPISRKVAYEKVIQIRRWCFKSVTFSISTPIQRISGWHEACNTNHGGVDRHIIYAIQFIAKSYRGLWELRIPSADGAVRIFYVYWENKIILVSGFIKKSQDTPRRELERAFQYLKGKESTHEE